MPLNRGRWFFRALAVSSLGSGAKLRAAPPFQGNIRTGGVPAKATGPTPYSFVLRRSSTRRLTRDGAASWRQTAVAARLERAGIDAKIDQHLLRLSPSIYNNQTDIDKLLNALS